MASALAMEVLISLPRFGDGKAAMSFLAHDLKVRERSLRSAFQELLDEFGVSVVRYRPTMGKKIYAAISRETWEVAQCEGQKYWDAQYSA